MSQRNVVITGASRGIGLALCRRFAGLGDRVVGVCRQASDDLRALEVEVVEDVDVTDPAGLQRLARALGDRRIDILINDAGVMTDERLEGLDEDAAARMMHQFEVNAVAPLRVTRALLDRLGDRARVAMITSRMGSIADNTSGGRYGYRMSKAALNMGTVSLAHDLAGRGVSVALIHPGFVRTDMTRGHGNVDPDEAAAGIVARIEALTPEISGGFWHANGERLPW